MVGLSLRWEPWAGNTCAEHDLCTAKAQPLPFSSPEPLGPRDQETTGSGDENGAQPKSQPQLTFSRLQRAERSERNGEVKGEFSWFKFVFFEAIRL